MLALALVCLALVALLAYREWGAARDRGRAAEEVASIRAEQAEERESHTKERRELYQRIQAPEVAVADAHLEARRDRPYVRRKPIGADDDKAFAERNERG